MEIYIESKQNPNESGVFLMPAVIWPGMQADQVAYVKKKGKSTQASCLKYAHCTIIKQNSTSK